MAPHVSELWLDTDLGFDDIHALLLLCCHGVRPVGQSLVFGCAALEQVVRNAQGIEAVFNIDTPWYAGARTALDGECRTAHHVLGDTGMLTRGLTLPCSNLNIQRDTALAAMIDWLSSAPPYPQILALGPLTNLAQLIIEAPQLAATVRQITWMGGSAGNGNQTAHAEFNAWADAEAASIVMQSGIRVHMVELEACRKLHLVEQDLMPLATLQSGTAQLLVDLLGGYLDIGLSRGRTSMALYDPLAAASITEVGKTALGALPVQITVDCGNDEYNGRTRIQSMAQVKDSVHSLCVVNNAAKVKAMILQALYTTAENSDLVP